MTPKMSHSKGAGLVLVTGASGFIGGHISNLLAESGFNVRAFVRPTSSTDKLSSSNVELVFGDIEDEASLERALMDVDYVVHAAADTSGSADGGQRITIDGTRRVVELCSNSPKKLIYISSCSVYQVAGLDSSSEIDESSKLEECPLARGPYTWAKHQAETIVTSAMRSGSLNATCLRPGFVYGNGGDLVNPMIGVQLSDRLVIGLGSPKQKLPAVHVLNVASAVAVCIENNLANGEIFNVVDSENMTKGRYLNEFVRPRVKNLRVFYISLWPLKPIVSAQEFLFKVIRRKPLLTSYRFTSSQNAVHIRGDRIRTKLGWRQAVTFAELAD
jgi:nucleoside-diphosphate-sugar epimerase